MNYYVIRGSQLFLGMKYHDRDYFLAAMFNSRANRYEYETISPLDQVEEGKQSLKEVRETSEYIILDKCV